MRDSLEDLKKENGITLVALVITVVIMLILAGVAIAAIVDGDGLFNRARQATESYEEAARDEADQIKTLMNEIDNYLGNVDDGDDEDNNPPAGGATIGEIVDANKTFDGQAEGTFDNPIIPKGFAPINENGADWGTEDGYQKGLVIRDAIGNDFVWVPVDATVTFARKDFKKQNGSYSSYSEIVPSNITTSVNKNGGFYIARYEAGQKVRGKIVSKKGASVYNNVNWNTAKTDAEAMYSTSDINYGAVSTLIYGTQWDTALEFIGTYGDRDTGYATDSTGKGNYSGTKGGDATTDTPATCGLLDSFRKNNIYDMAGNVWEWTMEQYSSKRVCRSGSYNNSGLDYPVSYRYSDDPTYSPPSIGFRVALYIK